MFQTPTFYKLFLEMLKLGSEIGEITIHNSVEVYDSKVISDHRINIPPYYTALQIKFNSLVKPTSVTKLYPLTDVADLERNSPPSEVCLRRGEIVLVDGLGFTTLEMEKLGILKKAT
jgi:hypothetical protein